MKSITDYFQREKKSDSSSQKVDSVKNSFDEDEPSSDVWVLYSSGDEVEGSDNERTHKKGPLLVQVPQPILDLDVVNKKRKRSCPDESISEKFSREDEEKVLHSSVHGVSEDECSFYMSPLRLESDSSVVTTPSSAKTKISATSNSFASSPVTTRTPNDRVSRRSLSFNKCESPCQKQDCVKGERINSDDNGKSGTDAEESKCLVINETFAQNSPEDFNCAVDERLEVASIASKGLIVETKSDSDEESEINLQPADEATNSVASIICTSSKNVSKEEVDNFLVMKKRTTSDDNLEAFDDPQRKAKRRKSDIPKNTLDDNPSENQNSLFNYFSRKETSPTVIKEDIFSDAECESIHIHKSPYREQVEERSHSPVICITPRKISRRKSETHTGTKLIEKEEGVEENAQDSSSQKSIASRNGGNGSSSDILERRSSLRLKHKNEIRKESINSNEEEMSPILHQESKAQKKSGKNTGAKQAIKDSQKVASKSGEVSKRKSSVGDGEEIVVLAESSSGNSKKVVIKEAYVRLAPLFLAKEELKKKQVFLQSGTPEVLRRKLQQQKQLEAELEERNEFPVISHVLQCDHRLFPWNLASKEALMSKLPEREVLPLAQQEVNSLIMKDNFHLGTVTDVSTLLANTLISARPPNLMDVELDFDFNFSSDKLEEYIPCFCLPQSKDGTASKVTPADVEKFLRVSLWIMRTMLPPRVAYKMHVDLSSFLPVPSPEGFIFDHISALPTGKFCSDLKRKMLLKLKEDYPGLPIHRWYKNVHQKRMSYGGLCSYENNDVGNSEGDTSSTNTIVGVNYLENGRSCSGNSSDSLNSSPKSVSQPKSCSSLSESYQISGKKKLNQEKLSSESWTDVFSPRCFDDVCILGKNLGSLNKLKDWLQKWKDRGSRVDKKTKTKGYCYDEEYSSGGEFYSSDDESDGDSRKKGKLPNVAIIIGECGSGKTSGVYAIAKELGLKVLEINASSKRSARNVLDAVKEATRSHQVNSSPLHSFLKNAGGMNSAKEPKNVQQNGESSGMSVIFVEDVDVVFDDRDDGFISALASLTSSSKRPFILEVHASEPLKMGSNNNLLLQESLVRSSPHLNILLAKQSTYPLLLPFQLTPKNVNAEAFLRVICLCEGVWVSKQWCECIFNKSLGDFRHALQQAHFWAGSVARANILHEGTTRYSDDVLEHIKPSKKINFNQENKIVANPCGCKNTHNCSYPYSWMFKDYIKQLWLNLDGIVNQSKANTLIKGRPNNNDFSNSKSTSSCESNFQSSKTDPPLLTCKQHTMVVSPMEIETNIRNGNICLAEGKELLAENFSNETQLIMSCSPKVKAGKGNKGRKKTSARHKLHIPDDDAKLKDQETSGGDEIPKMKDEVEEALCKSKLQSHAGMKSYFEALDLLSTCDVFLSKFEEREGNDLGRDMVFQMGILPDVINLFMQVTPSESSREMKAKMQKTVCSASQPKLILPLLPTSWVLRNRMLAHDVLPHIRETCRIQNDLAAMGRGRTRHSNRHPTLRQFGPSLRDALCSTLVDNTTNISEDNSV